MSREVGVAPAEVLDGGRTTASAVPRAPAEPTAGRPAPGGTIRHLQVVDGLRGVAILLVVLFHYWQLSFWPIKVTGLPDGASLEFVQFAGDLGVELFFFLSAFCLFFPQARAMAGQGEIPGLRHFYYRRAIKIVPSYLLVLLVCGVFFLSIYPVTYRHGLAGDLGLHALFLHNLDPQTRSSFDLVLWSLAVEVQFYYLFPLLAKACRRFPLAVPAALVIGALLWREWVREAGFADFWQWNNVLPAYLDVFALGMVAAYVVVRLQQRPADVARLRLLFTAVAVMAFATMLAMFRWRYSIRFDEPPELWRSNNRLQMAAIFACLTVGSVFAVAWWRRVLANRVLLFLSTISYNLYLWHAVLGRAVKDRGWWPADTVPPTSDPHWRWTYTLIGVGTSVAVATAITYGFERPLLRRGVRGAVRTLRERLRPAPTPTPEEISTTMTPDKKPATTKATTKGSPTKKVPTDAAPPPEAERRERLIAAAVAAVVTFAVYRWSYQGEGRHFDYFVRLSDAFLHGRTDLAEQPSWLSELIPHDGKFYVVFPPMPAILLMPFVAVFGSDMSQPLVSMLLGAASAGIAHLVLRRLFARTVAIWATVLYALGTNFWYHAEVGSAWYFAQVCAVFFLWLALLEGVTRRRPLVLGLLVGCAFSCRVTTLGAVAFVLVLLADRFVQRDGGAGRWRPQWRPLALFGAGLAPALALVGLYNVARFGSPTEFGYALIPGVLDEPWFSEGLESVHYDPHHFAEMFTALPTFRSEFPFAVPSLGMLALWVTTPALVLALRAPGRSRLTLAACAAVLAILPLNLAHGSNGFAQFGNRFSLDYLPFLVLLMAAGMRGRVRWWTAGLVVASVVVNLWGVVMISRLGTWTF